MTAKLVQYKFLPAVICCLLMLKIHAQVKVIYRCDSSEAKYFQLTALDSIFENESAFTEYISGLPEFLKRKGFLTASVDSVYTRENQFFIADIFFGRRYARKKITAPDISFADSVFIERSLKNDPYDITEILQYFSDAYADKGYPFAEISTEETIVSDYESIGQIKIRFGALVQIDSVRVIGKKLLSQKFLQQYVRVKRGTVYNSHLINSTDEKINQLSFVQTSSPSQIRFYQTGAVLDIYLKSRASNEINAILGLMSKENARPVLTGDAKLLLRNSFGNGEIISFNWQQLLPRSPQLNLFFSQPFLFSDRTGLQFQFDLFKKDSGFVSLRAETELNYYFKDQKQFHFGIRTFSSFLNNVDTIRIKSNRQLPDETDIQTFNFTFGFTDKSSAGKNYSKAWNIEVESEFGAKKIKRNNTILSLQDPAFKYSSLYDTIDLSSYNLKLKFYAEKLFNAGIASRIKAVVQGAGLFTQKYYVNELYRKGGMNSIRGFDDQSLFLRRYGIATFEYHYMFSNENYFRLFTDAAMGANDKTLYFLSAGGGITISSKTGILNLLYALGTRTNEPVNFRNGKIHIGFSALF